MAGRSSVTPSPVAPYDRTSMTSGAVVAGGPELLAQPKINRSATADPIHDHRWTTRLFVRPRGPAQTPAAAPDAGSPTSASPLRSSRPSPIRLPLAKTPRCRIQDIARDVSTTEGSEEDS